MAPGLEEEPPGEGRSTLVGRAPGLAWLDARPAVVWTLCRLEDELLCRERE